MVQHSRLWLPLLGVLLLLYLPMTGEASLPGMSVPAATPATAPDGISDVVEIDELVGTLEDPDQRARLIAQLRTLADARRGETQVPASVKTAASDAIESLAQRIADVTRSASSLLAVLQALPAALSDFRSALSDPDTRNGWAVVAGRLIAVMLSGFLAAALIRRVVSRDRPSGAVTQCRTRLILCRLLKQATRLFLDLLPMLAFAAAAYGVLAIVDPRHETRVVAVILINASLLSRLVLAISAFSFAPDHPRSRLWEFADETAQYLHHWVRRLAVIGIYGFAILQAALFLGLAAAPYQMLLRLLGLVILGLLLVLIAQNRQAVANAIAGSGEKGALRDADAAVATDEAGDGEGAAETVSQWSALRRGVARIWHLVAGLYLVTVFGIWALRVDEGAWFVLRATLLSLAIAAFGQLLMRVVDHLFRRGLRLSDDLRAGFPGLERRLNRYFPVFAKGLKLILGALGVVLLADVWGLDALSWLTDGSGRVLIGAGLNIVIIIVLALLVWELAGGAIERHLAQSDDGLVPGATRARTLLSVARNALTVTLVVVVVLMVMSELGINIAPLLAGAGVVGLAIGFGSQRLVQDVINGAFILFQDLMAVGDVVKLGDKAGVVEALSIRTVRLRDLQGTVHTVPFSSIETVSNLTREFSFHVFDLGIAYREDVDEVVELIKQVGEELRADPVIGPLILDIPEVWGLDKFGDSALVIKGRIKTKPIKQWQVGRAFNGLIKKRFDERGIEIPFPHQTIYFGADKDGTAPPAYVQQMEAMRAAASEPATK
ncbi:MAG: mechanosensitive ion channel [Gammaproteobacteria bacterium]|nr:mechanosensitive ion channel [Gammaproteobacteria bacterium]